MFPNRLLYILLEIEFFQYWDFWHALSILVYFSTSCFDRQFSKNSKTLVVFLPWPLILFRLWIFLFRKVIFIRFFKYPKLCSRIIGYLSPYHFYAVVKNILTTGLLLLNCLNFQIEIRWTLLKFVISHRAHFCFDFFFRYKLFKYSLWLIRHILVTHSFDWKLMR